VPGVQTTAGADLQIPGIRIEMREDGSLHLPPVVPKLRTDMWPHRLAEAVEAADLARTASAEIPPVVAAGDDLRLDLLLVRELRASMRAITAAAFALDAFYASVKARSPQHPDEQKWVENGTTRPAQISETLRYHLKIKNIGAKEMRRRIRELFKFRGWAVHPGSKLREPILRPDVDAGLDWHFAVFRAENAVNAVGSTVSLLDQLVKTLERGSEDLQKFKDAARRAMDGVLDEFEAAALPAFTRCEPPG
jgi:hypothetical protein